MKKYLQASIERFAIRLWSIVWRKWLIDWRGEHVKVVRVKGWRTAIVDYKSGRRQTITPCFSILGVIFD